MDSRQSKSNKQCNRRYSEKRQQQQKDRLTPGNRSARMPSNRGMSGARNLGWLTSLMERSMSSSSAMSPHFCLLAPAARSTLMTALMRSHSGTGWTAALSTAGRWPPASWPAPELANTWPIFTQYSRNLYTFWSFLMLDQRGVRKMLCI